MLQTLYGDYFSKAHIRIVCYVLEYYSGLSKKEIIISIKLDSTNLAN